MALLKKLLKPNIKKMVTNCDVVGLIETLGYHKSIDIQKAAIEALGDIGDKRSVEPLVSVLRKEETLRDYAADALGKIKDVRTVKPLIATVRDFKSHSAILALGEIGTQEALMTLIDELTNYDLRLRETIQMTLATAKCPEVTDLLLAILNDEEKDPHYCVPHILGRRNDERALKPLISASVNGCTYHMRAAAVEGLGILADKRAIKPIITFLLDKKIPGSLRSVAANALVNIGDLSAIQPLIDCLSDGDTWGPHDLRIEASRALGEIGNGLAIDPLLKMLDFNDVIVRVVSAKALRNLYHSGKLSPTERRRIEEYEDEMAKPIRQLATGYISGIGIRLQDKSSSFIDVK